MSKNFKLHHSRITLASLLGRRIISILGCIENGTIFVDGEIQPCTIDLYCVGVSLKEKSNIYRTTVEERYVLVSETESGELLSNDNCKEILELPVKDLYGKWTQKSIMA